MGAMLSFWGVDGSRAVGWVLQSGQRMIRARLASLIPLFVASIAALQTSYLVTWSVRELGERGVAMDDAYFYAVLADNYQEKGYLTFDGTMPTNDVQPLWQWMIIGLHRAFPNVELMRTSFAANWILYPVFCWLVVRHALRVCPGRFAPHALAVSLLVACNPGFQAVVLRGMEAPLFLMCFAALLNLVQHASQYSSTTQPSHWLAPVLGSLAGVTFLARTDWFWVVPLGALFVWNTTQRKALVALFGTASSLVVIPYLAHNWLQHGHLMPISGRTKLALLDLHTTGFVDYLQSDEWHGVFSILACSFGVKSLWFAIPLAAGLVYVGVRRFSIASPSARFLLLGVACHTLFMHVVYREVRPYTNYYFSAEVIAAAYLFAEAVAVGLDYLRQRMRPVALKRCCYGATSAVVLLVGAATLMFYTAKARDKWVWRWQMAERLRALPSDEKVAAFWPGAFAYVSGRSVFPLDGIVGSEEYLDVVREGRELEYVRSRDIDYVVIADLPPDAIHASKPPEIDSWAELGKLRLWQDCAFVKRLVATHGNATKHDAWYLYELLDTPSNQRCHAAAGRRPPSVDDRNETSSPSSGG